MKRLLPLLLLPVLAACDEAAMAEFETAMGITPPAPEAPEVVPPEVAPYLPPGTPASVVATDVNGCYVFSIEVTDPPTGFPVRDASGNQVCPPGTSAPATAAAPAAPAPADGA